MKDLVGDPDFLGHPSGGRSEVEGKRREGAGGDSSSGKIKAL